MRIVEDALEELKAEYGGAVNFKRICEDRGILVSMVRLEEGMNGFAVVCNNLKLIVLSDALPHAHRRDFAFHELWHILKSARHRCHGYCGDRREEARANLFAALCRISTVREGDTVDSLVERHGVSHLIAKTRLEYENKKVGK